MVPVTIIVTSVLVTVESEGGECMDLCVEVRLGKDEVKGKKENDVYI